MYLHDIFTRGPQVYDTIGTEWHTLETLECKILEKAGNRIFRYILSVEMDSLGETLNVI